MKGTHTSQTVTQNEGPTLEDSRRLPTPTLVTSGKSLDFDSRGSLDLGRGTAGYLGQG
jgi:hypothetical protein